MNADQRDGHLLKHDPWAQWSCSPACTELEQVTLDWAAKLLGLGETFWNSSKIGGGQITVSSAPILPAIQSSLKSNLKQGAASESAIVATVAARERCLRLLSLQDAAAATVQSDLDSISTEVKIDELGTRVNDADNDISDEVRDKYSAKLIMYGSTQTHSIGIKVRSCP